MADSARKNPVTGADGQHITFCRLCEACCGLAVEVEGGRIVAIRPDRENPHSKGHICVKAAAFTDVLYDPDRVTTPLKRNDQGEFDPVSWPEAIEGIGARLRDILSDQGPDAIAFYSGHPTSFSSNTSVAHGGFMKAIGSRKAYGPSSQDGASRLLANQIIFGATLPNPIPDLVECDFLIILGANPLISNGSFLYAPRIRHDLDAISDRSGVVVVDPRQTETARRYEHLAVRPGGDVWLLLGLLKTLFEEGLADRRALADQAIGIEQLEAEIMQLDFEEVAKRSSVEADTIRKLARRYAAIPKAAVYGRLGICRGKYSTLTNFLVTALDVVGGKFGVRGGTVFGYPVLAGGGGVPEAYGDQRSRIGDIPAIARYLPSAAMQDDILLPGPGQVRALFVTAGNPVLSAPGSARLQEALSSLDLMVSFDLYLTETARKAHYVLPAASFLERADFPHLGMGVLGHPFLQFSDAVIPPTGEAREEYEIYRDIIRAAGLEWPRRSGAKLPTELDAPLDRLGQKLRAGPAGDAFGAHGGWSITRLRDHPHGVMVDLPHPADDLQSRIAQPDGKLRLWHPLIEKEFARLRQDAGRIPDLALIGRRNLKSLNCWMHNVKRLARSQHPKLLIHGNDALRHDLKNGGLARLSSEACEIEVEIEISNEMRPGSVSYPHGWGHAGGWQHANALPGSNFNALIGDGPDNFEQVSGSTILDGFEVFLEPIG